MTEKESKLNEEGTKQTNQQTFPTSILSTVLRMSTATTNNPVIRVRDGLKRSAASAASAVPTSVVHEDEDDVDEDVGEKVSLMTVERDIKVLKDEIKALKWLSDRKEREWNRIIRLLKIKEERLILKSRTKILAQQDASSVITKGSSLIQRFASITNTTTLPKTSSSSSTTSSPVKMSTNGTTPSVTITTVSASETNGIPKNNKVRVCQGCNQKPSQFVCAGCSNRWYCSRDCQVQDWDEHADYCSDGED